MTNLRVGSSLLWEAPWTTLQIIRCAAFELSELKNELKSISGKTQQWNNLGFTY